MAQATTISEVLALHNKYQDSMVAAFETNLRQIVLRAQGRVLSDLQGKLSITEGVIDSAPANMRALRGLGPAFMDAMRKEGYDRLVDAFVGEFKGMLPFLNDTFRLLGEEVDSKWQSRGFSAKELNLLASSQINATASIDAAVESVAGTAMTRGLFGMAGLRFGTLAKVLTERFETSIARARTMADTSMSTFYRTATDTAFQAIEEDLPQQEIRLRYSGPDDKLTRPFCDRLIQAGKSYTREEIGRMNNGQLPNVLLTGGGWNCRHQWILDTSAIAPAGRLVSVDSILSPAGIDIAPSVRVATAAIDRVHRVPELAAKVPIIGDAKMLQGGVFKYVDPIEIKINSKSDHKELTAVLEIGHLLDHAAIGDAGKFASISDPVLAAWRKAIDNTNTIQKLEDLKAAGSIPYASARGIIQAPVRRIATELLEPAELFSRSYAQFITAASGDPTLARQIAGFLDPRNPSSVVPYYWDSDDFQEVARVFKQLIIDLRWNKK